MELDGLELQFGIKQALKQLKQEAKEAGMRISAKPKKDYVCVLSALETFELKSQFINDFHKIFPPIKSHLGKSIDTFAQFVRSNGGVKSSVEKVRIYLKIAVTDGAAPASRYASSVFDSLLDIQACVPRRNLKKSQPFLPYCAFCWRRIEAEESSGYCYIHHPNQSKNAFYKAKSALESALKHTRSIHLDELQRVKSSSSTKHKYSMYAFKWTASFSRHPRYINKALVDRGMSGEVTNENIKAIAAVVLSFIKTEYPKTYSMLPYIDPDDLTSWQDFTLLLLNALDSTEAAFWEAENMEAWMNPGVGHNDIFVLLMVLHRHEAYQVINSLPRTRGPKKGADLSNRNDGIRLKIRDLANVQLSTRGKINRAEIGRELSISRQRVSVLMSEITID